MWVDGSLAGSGDFAARFRELDRLQPMRSPEGKTYALWFQEPLDVVATVLHLRRRGASALLLHADTPPETALNLAAAAGCDALLTGSPLQAILPEGIARRERTEDPPALLQFSSGTTGAPKLIVRPWTDIDREIVGYNSRLAPSGGEPPLVLVPVTHSYGMIAGVLAGMARLSTPRIVRLGNPKAALRHIRENPSSIVYAVPFLYQLLNSLSKGEVRYRKAISSGAPFTESLLARMTASAGEVWQQYGCSECGCVALGAHPEKPEDVGLPLSHLSVGLRSGKKETAAEGAGEIVVRDAQGFTATGDLGLLSPQGRLSVLGRLDELINVSGRKVMPAEVERIIAAMEGIREVVVYGTRHPVWGEAVSAMVVTDGGVGAEEIRERCALQMAAFKVPHTVRFVEEIPRPASGKISRKYLREREE